MLVQTSNVLLCWLRLIVCHCCVAGDAEGFGKEHVHQEAVEVDSPAVDVSCGWPDKPRLPDWPL